MKKIAMKCSQEDWDSIKDKLDQEKITLIASFNDHPYLANDFNYEGLISNISKPIEIKVINNYEIHETFNAKIFLDACGIETKPTLEEVKERFKDAETIQTIFSKTEFEIDTEKLGISFDGSCYRQNADSENREILLWDNKKGYAKIITKKTPKYQITKKTVLKYDMKDEFPDVFKKEMEVGKWYKDNYSKLLYFILEIKNENNINAYGFNKDGIYSESNDNFEWGAPESIKEATPQEVETALINYLEKQLCY